VKTMIYLFIYYRNCSEDVKLLEAI